MNIIHNPDNNITYVTRATPGKYASLG